MSLVARGLSGGPVQDLDLELATGLTVVTGEPECGTSTLLRLLAGEQRPDRGTVSGGTGACLSTGPPEVSTHRNGVRTHRGGV